MNDITIYNKMFRDELYEEIDASVKWTDTLTHIHTDKPIKLKRSMAYVSDSEAIYYYDKFFLTTQLWNETLTDIKRRLEEYLGVPFNSVILNKYKNGKDKINWHSDKEDGLGPNPIIACVNFGATRRFWFLNKETGEKTFYLVSHGDILVMGPNCQKNYLHAILPEKDVTEPRISLTFRKVIV